MRIFILLLSLLLFPVQAAAQDEAGRIVVTGIGHASAPPDKAVIRIEVSHTDRRNDVAMQDLTAAVEAVLSAVRAHGIAEEDIETSSFSLTENWNYNEGARTFDGYEAESNLRIEVRQLSAIGSLITTLSSGAGVEIRGPFFELENEKSLRDEARRKAVQDGVATARLLAEAAGVTLGPPLLITDGTKVSDEPNMRELIDGIAHMEEPMMEAEVIDYSAKAIPVIPADIETTETAKLIFRIEP